jgi:hypothetical protein
VSLPTIKPTALPARSNDPDFKAPDTART